MPLPLLPIAMGAMGLGKIFSGGAEGAAKERTNQNQFRLNQNQQELGRYGTHQNALLSAILARGRDAQDRYQTRQGATTNAMHGEQGATTTALGQQSAEGLQLARLGLEAPTTRARQSILGSVMKNLQPVQISGGSPRQEGRVPKITGGLSAATLDPTTREHGETLMNDALMAQLSKSDIPKPTDFKSGILDWKSSILDAPEATDYQSAVLAPPELGGYKQPGKMESILSGAGIGGGVLGEILKLIAGAQGSSSGNGLPIDLTGGG